MRVNKVVLILALLAVSLILTTPAQTEEPVALTKGLVAYWSFDEGEGDIVFLNTFNNEISRTEINFLKGVKEYGMD